MSGVRGETPQLLPVLSRGKHRNPRRGACFMEMASWLAGERWSDHPSCTHPLLAGLARMVNDNTPDDLRSQLAVLIPSVIGLTGGDVRVDAEISLVCARRALPIASFERQRVLAVGVLSCERVIAGLDGRADDDIRADSRAALDTVPEAEQWARHFMPCHLRISHRVFRSQTAPRIVNLAVEGTLQACVPDPHQRLHDMLVAAIEEVTALVGATAPTEEESLERLAAIG